MARKASEKSRIKPDGKDKDGNYHEYGDELSSLIEEYLETERNFRNKCVTFIEVLKKVQEKFSEDPQKVAYLGDIIDIYSKIIPITEDTIKMIDPALSVEEQLEALKSGYSADYAQRYFDTLSPSILRCDEFLAWFAHLEKSDKKKITVVLKDMKVPDTMGSFLTISTQRGPRHELLFKEMNKKTADYKVGHKGYLGFLIENVQRNIRLVNEEGIIRQYAQSKGISIEEVKADKSHLDIISAREERKALDEKVNEMGGLVTGKKLFRRTQIQQDDRKEFVDNMLTELSVEWYKAKKNQNWDGYISKIEAVDKAYKEAFKKGRQGKVSEFLSNLKEEAIKLKEHDQMELKQARDLDEKYKAEHSAKFSEALKGIKSRRPEEALSLEERGKLVRELEDSLRGTLEKQEDKPKKKKEEERTELPLKYKKMDSGQREQGKKLKTKLQQMADTIEENVKNNIKNITGRGPGSRPS